MLAQVRPPEELLIIDQSPGDESARLIPPMFDGACTRLIYVHDPGVTGLVDAKRVGSSRAAGEIVCFLEDDVILEPDYIAQIERGFAERPDMLGSSGVITNPPSSVALYRSAHALFFRGIFKDGRPRVYHRALHGAHDLIRSHVLSGGLSAWRRHVFDRVSFDTRNGFFMFEDMEFATRVVREMGPYLFVNPRARLEHNFSAINRDIHGVRQRRKTSEALVFYRKRKDWQGARLGLTLAMTWWFFEAALQAVRLRSPGPISGYFAGIGDGLRRPLLSTP